MLNNLLNINELDTENWINYQDRINFRRRVNEQVLSVELYINKPLDMTLEVCALKKVLIDDLLIICREGYERRDQNYKLSDQYLTMINEYKEYLEVCNVNYLYDLWLQSPACCWE